MSFSQKEMHELSDKVLRAGMQDVLKRIATEKKGHGTVCFIGFCGVSPANTCSYSVFGR